MNRFLFLFSFQLLFAVFAFAQSGNDSILIPSADSVVQPVQTIPKDSLVLLPTSESFFKRTKKGSFWKLNPETPVSISTLRRQILQHHPYFGFKQKPISIHSDIKEFNGNELLFYVIVALFLSYALLRRSFPKYFNDLYRLFFRTTLKQLQIREQLMQTPLPSLFMNIFFVISGGLYISFVIEYEQLMLNEKFWRTFIYCFLALSGVYLFKFLGLKLSGWLFNMKEAAESYIFIVFVVNKMIGVILLPFLALLAYTKGNIYSVSYTLSWLVIAGLLTYRFVLTYGVVRKQIKVNPFHFFLYLCAFEIAPLLLIYKGLLLFFHITA